MLNLNAGYGKHGRITSHLVLVRTETYDARADWESERTITLTAWEHFQWMLLAV